MAVAGAGWLWCLILAGGWPVSALGTAYYVAQNSANPAPPYTDWSTAATNIQDAINVATNGDQIWVTNGVYGYGGLAMAGTLSNRVALNKPLTVQSVNGPWVTIIQGPGTTNGPTARRCAWLTNGAALKGFTLQGGATALSGSPNTQGGGVWCASASAIVANCVIVSNTCLNTGGGAYQGTLQNCWISGNSSVQGAGGAASTVLNNCTVVYNGGVGVTTAICTNCIIYYSGSSDHQVGGAFAYCCTTVSPGGVGNITTAPQLFADGVHLQTGSPCIGTGTNVATGTDIFGHAWNNPPSMGCTEWTPAPVAAQPVLQFLSYGLGANLHAAAIGQGALSFFWSFNGVPIADNGHYTNSATATLRINNFGPDDAGVYQVVVSNAVGLATSQTTQLVVHVVNAAGGNPVAPYSTWATAATNIQDAINAAGNGDQILVTNGIYAAGGLAMAGTLTNRVALYVPVMVESVNGPGVTIIQGAGATNGPSAVRCAWLTNGAALMGFTLQGGATQTTGTTSDLQSGGGVWCASTKAWVANCIIISNTAAYYGGGFYQGWLLNSLVTHNTDTLNQGGGAAYANLNNCTVISNTAYGIYQVNATNSIVYFNTPSDHSGGTTAYDCTTLPTGGNNNLSAAPQLFMDATHLAAGSPCIAAGLNPGSGTDLFGQPWSNPPAIGCAEWQPAPTVAQPQIKLNGNLAGFNVVLASLNGQPPFSLTWLDNGVPVQNNGHFSLAQTTNLTVTGVTLADAGAYQVVVSNAFGVVTSAVAPLVIHAVDAAGTSPSAPYATWDTAATSIQDAINVAGAGDIVLVTNGVYATGGLAVAGNLTNRVALTLPVTVVSVNGYAATIIQGAWDPVTTNGPAAVRCAYVADGARLTGFTLCNGATRATGDSGAGGPLESGGGVLCHSTNGVVANCYLTNNFAVYGGGVANGTLNNSLVLLNQATSLGGGAYYATLNNCTVVNNVVKTPTAVTSGHGAGTYYGVVNNSIVMGNVDKNLVLVGNQLVGNNFDPASPAYANSCTSPLPAYNGNINVTPLFLDALHLATNSPCRAVGNAGYASGTDLDGQPWANPPTMGCSEVVVSNLVGPLTVSMYAYQTNVLVNRAASYGLTYTGHATTTKFSYGDGQTLANVALSAGHVYSTAGTYTVTYTVYNNDNPAGVSISTQLTVLPLPPAQLAGAVVLTNGFQFQFPGVAGLNYTIQYSTNLVPPVTWKTLTTVPFSSSGLQIITDPAAATGTRFYRVLEQ